MAASSIPSLFSFFTPSKPPSAPTKAQPCHLTISSSATTTKNGWTPLVSSSNEIQPNTLSLSSSCSSDVMSVVCPSFVHANTLFFRSAYNVQVIVDENEPEEKLLGRFRREVMRAGVIQECKRRRFFENKQDEKKRKTREAAKRNRRRRPQARNFTQDRQETTKNKKEEEEDNWDLPEGNIPY
ncbi:Ribosomal protein S21 family protein [Forsythia ovata]|uniref:Ribosomal protein S21 family protein n=1 Tax=Forsythia ovata TaxID=205694 RepID=A0ABD1UDT2_9LAMI